MPTGEHPFVEIAMYFVGELLESEGFNANLVGTNQFTKVQSYIAANTTWIAEDVADSYINDIWKLYGLPTHLTSDRGLQFAPKFLKEVHRKLNIKLGLSTTYILQTDRVSKQAVWIFKQYLHIYCHVRQNCW